MKKNTKKICLALILALVGIAGVKAQRIYASELNAAPTATGYDFSFTLNTAATNGAIILQSSENTDTIPFGALSKGRNSIPVDRSRVTTKGNYTWAVTVSTAPLPSPVLFTDNANPQVQFYSALGVSVDNDFDSPFFGRVYVASGLSGATASRATGQGIYILDAAMSDVTNQGANAYSGGVSYAAYSASPLRCNVAPDGQVYMNDWTSSSSGVYVMNPANPSVAFRQIYGGARVGNTGLFQYASTRAVIGGPVGSCFVLGKSDTARLYTFDTGYLNPGSLSVNGPTLTRPNNVLQYNIGTSTSAWVSAPSNAAFDNGAAGYIELNGNSVIAPDARGGWFISQSRDPGNDTPNCPVLIHVSASGKVDFNSGVSSFIGSSVDAGMAVTSDGNRLAISANNDYKIYDITYDAQNVPSLTLAYDINPGDQAYSLAFDRAGNLYAISTATTSFLAGYGLPITDNTFVTPAPATQVLTY